MGGGHHDDHAVTERRVLTAEEMEKAKIPIQYRDFCADLLVPLDKCRRETHHLPWACGDFRHAYEKCQYEDFVQRQKAFKEGKKTATAQH